MKIEDMKFVSRDLNNSKRRVALWPIKPKADSSGDYLCEQEHSHLGDNCWIETVQDIEDIEPGQCLPITIKIDQPITASQGDPLNNTTEER